MPSETSPAEPSEETPTRVLMSVDDAGDYLLCTGSDLVIGHVRGPVALPLLADVGAEHARLLRRTSLAAGAEWFIEPVGAERVSRNAEPLGGASVLVDEDELSLGANVRLRFRQPDLASETAILDLPGGVDCLGAGHVALFAAGRSGRLRIGAREGRHVRVPALEPGCELAHARGRLLVTAPAGARVAGGEAELSGEAIELPFPPPERVFISIGRPLAGARPPFSFSLTPLDG